MDEAWKGWKKHFGLTATEYEEKSNNVKTCWLLSCIRQKGREIYETFEFNTADPENPMKFDLVTKKFELYCTPRKNVTISRHNFFTYKQTEGQTFSEFVTQLRSLSDECEFETLKHSLIKDMIVCGTLDNKLRERLLREANLTLDNAIKLGHAAAETKKHIKALKSSTEQSVNEVRARLKADSQSSMINKCKYCSYNHPRGMLSVNNAHIAKR